MVRARPIAASPAAIVITKMEKTWPVWSESFREKAMKFRFTAFNISSTDIRTVRKLRRTSTPKKPIEKSRKLAIRKWLIVIVIRVLGDVDVDVDVDVPVNHLSPVTCHLPHQSTFCAE